MNDLGKKNKMLKVSWPAGGAKMYGFQGLFFMAVSLILGTKKLCFGANRLFMVCENLKQCFWFETNKKQFRICDPKLLNLIPTWF